MAKSRCRCSIAAAGRRVAKRALQLLHSHDLREVAADERERSPAASSPCQVYGLISIASPSVAATRRRRTRGSSSVDRRGRRDLVHPRPRGRRPRRRAELGDVRLAPAHDQGDDAHAGAAGDAQPAALVVDAPVGGGQSLGQRAQRASREVVVVVALDRSSASRAARARWASPPVICARRKRLPFVRTSEPVAGSWKRTSRASGGRSSEAGGPSRVAKRLLIGYPRRSAANHACRTPGL